MPGEDQERFEDYLELERYIEALQEGRVAHPPSDLTPTQARIYQAAALFRAASPGAATPRPEFVEELRERLLALDQTEDEDDTLKLPRVKAEEAKAASQLAEQDVMAVAAEKEQAAADQPMEQNAGTEKEQGEAGEAGEQEIPVLPVPERTRPNKNAPRRARFFSRRSILTESAVAAASLVVGTGIGAIGERSASSIANKAAIPTPTYDIGPGSYGKMPLVEDGSGIWHYVGMVDEIGENALRFVTDTIVGYVIRSDGDDGEPKGIVAMSAACTHMGCLVQWQASDRQYHCPCHEGVFTEYGKPSPDGKMKYLAALPRLKTMTGDTGEVYVFIPKTAQ